jgi:hypothetical protein
MARVIVRQVAREAGTLNHLCHRLAEQIPTGEERRTFLKKCLATPLMRAQAPGPPKGVTPPTNVSMGVEEGAGPVVRRAFDEKLLKRVEHELAIHIGPLARVLVKKAAKDAVTLPDLVRVLAENISEDDDRRVFEEAVRRLGETPRTKKRLRVGSLSAAAAPVAAASLFGQGAGSAYHVFADTRTFLGVPNALTSLNAGFRHQTRLVSLRGRRARSRAASRIERARA